MSRRNRQGRFHIAINLARLIKGHLGFCSRRLLRSLRPVRTVTVMVRPLAPVVVAAPFTRTPVMLARF
jgi:hypothetical protein